MLLWGIFLWGMLLWGMHSSGCIQRVGRELWGCFKCILNLALKHFTPALHSGTTEEYSDDLAEETGITDDIPDEIDEDELDEEDIPDETGLAGGSDSGSIADETEAGPKARGGSRAQAASSVSAPSVISEEEPAYSDSFGTAPPQSHDSAGSSGGTVGMGGGRAASVLSGMTEAETDHARRIAQLKREVEMKKRQVGEGVRMVGGREGPCWMLGGREPWARR